MLLLKCKLKLAAGKSILNVLLMEPPLYRRGSFLRLELRLAAGKGKSILSGRPADGAGAASGSVDMISVLNDAK